MKLIRLVFNGFTCSLLSIKRDTNRSFMFLGGLLVTVFALQSEVWGFDPRPVQF